MPSRRASRCTPSTIRRTAIRRPSPARPRAPRISTSCIALLVEMFAGRCIAPAGRVLVRRRDRHEPRPAARVARHASLSRLARRVSVAAVRRSADPELQGGGKRRAALPRDLPPQSARQHARATRRASPRRPSTSRPTAFGARASTAARSAAAARSCPISPSSGCRDPRALGRARRLGVPSRESPDRRDPLRGRHARRPPEFPRPATGRRTRTRPR